jgi:UDP-N-acetylglucosamine--N-acetylmuramyl-(pentapeptide) pyrophosphoryl-undecaprenol N-acetylglucosamine transferase
VYPILAVLQSLDREGTSPSEVWYVGNASGIEARLAQRAGLPFRGISTPSFHGARPWLVPARLAKLAHGTTQCMAIIQEFRPEALFATGGYVCAPAVLAAWLSRVPSLLYLPDLTPGLAIRFLGRLAEAVAVSSERSVDAFPPGKAVVTGYPVRRELFQTDKITCRRRLQLDDYEKTLLVLGGSQGAHSINLAVSNALERLLEVCQVVHICGAQDLDCLSSGKDALPEDLSSRYRVFPYLHEEMIFALGSADLALARAGAATMGEFPALGLPSILVPYPHAGRHQELNADYMVENGAALKIDDSELGDGALVQTIVGLLNDEDKLAALAQGARRLAHPDAATRLSQLLHDISRTN